MTRDHGSDDTGVPVYPRLPLPPKPREAEIRIPKRSQINKLAIAVTGGALAAGFVLGFVVRPKLSPDARIGELEGKLTDTDKAAATQKTRADGLDKDLDQVRAAKIAAEKKLVEAQKAQTALADKAAEAEAAAKEAQAAKQKLQATVDKSIGTVSADGNEIRLKLVDKVLFKTGDDQLTDRGKQVLAKVAIALKEMSDKQVWVHGHTDDQPIVVPKPPPAPPPRRGQRPAPAPAPAPVVRFPTNWELSAARALTVVHYLQDVAKVDPKRLAALAFGQYRPLSTDKASNRRIEIVLYPKPELRK